VRRLVSRRLLLALLGLALPVSLAIALATGPVALAPRALLAALIDGIGGAAAGRDALIVFDIRLPRVLLGPVWAWCSPVAAWCCRGSSATRSPIPR
jgi:hypothetical protein